MQSYKPEKISENKKVTSDYNAVKNIWMESYKGNIFAAGYGAGDYNLVENGGRLMQMDVDILLIKRNIVFINACIITMIIV